MKRKKSRGEGWTAWPEEEGLDGGLDHGVEAGMDYRTEDHKAVSEAMDS